MELKIEAPISLRINKEIPVVFAAFTDPLQTRNYLCDAMSGDWSVGKKVVCRFGENHIVLQVEEVIINELLRFRWLGAAFID